MASIKELLQQYAAYNRWATQKLFDVILSLPDEMHTKEIPSSYTSLYKTVFHLWDAESIWWQRMKLQEVIVVPTKTFSGTTAEIMKSAAEQSKQWVEWINNATDMALEHVFMYKKFDGQQIKQPIWQMLLHVFNHATYHRGQIVNMLRQIGIEKIPATDFSVWAVGRR